MWVPTDRTKLIQDHKNGIPLKELAARYQVSVEKIRAFLIHDHSWIPYKTGKISLPEQEVISLYKQDWTKEQIALKFGVSVGPIVNILNHHNVRKPKWAKTLSYNIYEQVSDRDVFANAVDNHISKQKVAEYFGLNYDMVASLYERYNIKGPRNSGEVKSHLNRKNRNGIPFTKEEVEKQHFKYNKSIQDIADLIGISTNYLRKRLSEWGVTTRDTRISLKFRNFKKLSNEEIQKIVDNTPVTTLHKELEVCYDLLSSLLKERNIKIPTRFISQGEKRIGDFVESYNINIDRNNRKIIYPYELDVYIPSHKVAIEYCGLYWHSELNNRNRNYHIDKLNKCTEKGIRLLTIFEDEYINHPEIVESKICSILHLRCLPKINARQCIIREITPHQKRKFLNENHIQGDDISSVKLGLFYSDQLVSVMTFAKPSRSRSSNRMVKQKNIWELNRFATDVTVNVRGAAGKLLSYFKNNYQWNEIFSYADRRWSTGNMYFQLGFTHTFNTRPNYWYVPKGYYQRNYRYNYAKFKLIEQGFDKNKSEKRIMEERGFTRIWDCGHYKFVMRK